MLYIRMYHTYVTGFNPFRKPQGKQNSTVLQSDLTQFTRILFLYTEPNNFKCNVDCCKCVCIVCLCQAIKCVFLQTVCGGVRQERGGGSAVTVQPALEPINQLLTTVVMTIHNATLLLIRRHSHNIHCGCVYNTFHSSTHKCKE